MSSLRQALDEYLTLRRQLGYELKRDGEDLVSFVAFLDAAGATRITTALAVQWAKLPTRSHPHRWRQRLGRVRGFACYLATIDPQHEVPAKDLLPARQVRVAPYLYSQAEVSALLSAARRLTPALLGTTLATLVGLMATTGLRIGEALALDRSDVDFRDGILLVRAGKHRRQRQVPLHDSTLAALREYCTLRDRLHPSPSTPAFLLSERGCRFYRTAFYENFPKLIAEVGLEGRGARKRPRAHDLRHTFAVRTLLEWHRQGVEIDRKLPVLSTYLGHVDPVDTYWYLQATPELGALVAARLDGMLGGRS